jgi:hypothetical protein
MVVLAVGLPILFLLARKKMEAKSTVLGALSFHQAYAQKRKQFLFEIGKHLINMVYLCRRKKSICTD